ncbi:MAG: hypothetical protein LBR79_04385 [Oscillospiraceae bacterium]|jgi:hypothetical protein|nr:hypothetical protein [Oscillospiraceae bacterium]
MAIKAKENAQTGLLHKASKCFNEKGHFEKTLKSLVDDIIKLAEQFQSVAPIDVSGVVNAFNELIKKREAFTKVKNSKKESEIEPARIAAQQAVQNAAGSGSGGLNTLIATVYNVAEDMKKACANNIVVLDEMSRKLTLTRTEIDRKNDKDGKAYGKNYAKPMSS